VKPPSTVIEAAIIAEPKDSSLVDQIESLLGQTPVTVQKMEDRPTSAKGRAELESRLCDAGLILVVWTTSSIQSPWALDQADIAAHHDTLLNVEAGARTPLGYGDHPTIRIKVKTGTIVAGAFDLLERILVFCEDSGSSYHRRIGGFRYTHLLIDIVILLVPLALFARGHIDPRRTLFGVIILLAIPYMSGFAGDRIALRLGVPFRRYVWRLLATFLAQSAVAMVAILFINRRSNVDYFLTIKIWLVFSGLFLIRTTPYLFSKRLRRRLLA
jgi:hypothetical protein